MVYSTLIRSNISNYGIFDLGKVEYTGMWYIRPWKGGIYRNMVYSTLVRSNIPEYGIFDAGKVIYTISSFENFLGVNAPDPLRGAVVWLKLSHELAKMLDPLLFICIHIPHATTCLYDLIPRL